ncbi:hypothetical protein Tco_0421352, partial [Tanacetum coccineum]
MEVKGSVKVINMIITRGGRKRPYEAGKPGLTEEITFPPVHQSNLTDGPIILEGGIEGYHVRRIFVDGGSSSEIMYENCFKKFDARIRSRIRKCNTPLIMGWVMHSDAVLRSCDAVL